LLGLESKFQRNLAVKAMAFEKILFRQKALPKNAKPSKNRVNQCLKILCFLFFFVAKIRVIREIRG